MAEMIEDHALNRVPSNERKSGWWLSWLTMGITSTLVQLLIGSVVTAMAGVGYGILAGICVWLFGGTLGWLVGRISFMEGVSSTVASRFYGLGARGSIIASAIYGFMILGFLALENALLYYGTLFALGWKDTTAHRLLLYGILTVLWIVLTTFGVKLVMRVSSILTIIFLALLLFMVWKAGFTSGVSIGTILSHGALIPNMGGTGSRFMQALVTLAGSAGGLAMVDADYARYAKSSRDVAVMAFAGLFIMDILVVVCGTIIMVGGAGPAAKYIVAHHMAAPGQAKTTVSQLAQNNTGAFFIILSAVVGFILMYAAQIKAQVLNTYSGSLALTNFFDVLFKWRPGRFLMVILGNLIGMGMVFAGILGTINAWLGMLGILTMSFSGVMISDYYWVRKRELAHHSEVESVNLAGVVSVIGASVISYWLQQSHIFPLGFLASLILTMVLYYGLRVAVLKPGMGTSLVQVDMSVREEATE
ncbi:purine-cytosine permease-like transporter [Alicyclobacillus sp. SO9]|nr:purine-cytosine permease-like transporter [Alicyclobacillus sp. SO9]